MFMNEHDNGADTAGFEGMGRWFAVASEIPCSVVALLLVGQIAGTALLGPSGATTGAEGLLIRYFQINSPLDVKEYK